MAVEGAGPEVEVDVGLNISQASLGQLEAVIRRAMTGSLDAFLKFEKAVDSGLKDVRTGFTKVGDAADEAFSKGTKASTDMYAKLIGNEKAATDFALALKEVGLAIGAQVASINRVASQERKVSDERQRDMITLRLEQDRTTQERIENERNATKLLAVQYQTQGQQALVAQRQAGVRRIQAQRAVLETLARLEKALGKTIAGTARTAVSAVSRSSAAIGGILTRNNREFTQGLDRSLTTREKSVRSSFTRQERLLTQTLSRQSSTIQRINRQISTGVSGAVSGRGVGAGVGAIGGGVGVTALLTSGFQRFSDLERINKQFLALTGSIEDTNLLLDQVKQFAKTTPFDVVGVADLAKGFLAIGTATEDVLPQVTAIADAVALTGGGVQELERIQRAIGQVVSTGKLQGDELNQLAENLPGLNIRKILADQLTGGDVQALVEMQEAGELTADKFVGGLITGLQEDKRLVGASQDLANTLGGKAANLKESFADLGASIIGAVQVPLKAGITGMQTLFQGLADFIKGEVNPELLVLRDFLGGVALGLGAIVAAKGAVEVFGLIGSAVKLAVTPMGLLVVAAGLLGGTLVLMAKHSAPFREALDELRTKAVELGQRIKLAVVPILERLGAFIEDTLIPGVIKAADYVGTNLFDAFDAVVSFVQTKVIPVFKTVARVVTQEVVPAVVGFVDGAVDGIADLARRIRPLVQPVIDGFKQVGSAIGAAFSGDFSRLGSGALGLAKGIGETVKNIVGRIVDALKPIGERIVSFFKDLFSNDKLGSIALGFLVVVEQIGRILGSIVSDPRFIAALAAIAAAAAATALAFVKGFAEGVLSNLPIYLKAASEVLAKIIFDPKLLLAAAAAVFTGRAIFNAFRSFGAQAGKEVSTGFAKTFQSGLAASFAGAGGFLQGAVAGSAKGIGFQSASQQAKQLAADVINVQKQLRILGGPQIYAPTKAGLEAARAAAAKLEAPLTNAQRAGLEFRDSIRQSMQGATRAMLGFKQIATGALAGGLKNAVAGVYVGGKELTKAAVTVGKQMGVALAAGLAAGLGGFVAGRAEGQAGGSGIMSALLGGATAGAMIGGGWGAAVGTVTAGVALIGAEFGRAERAAKLMKERIAEVAEVLKGDLVEGLSIGTDGVLQLVEALAGGGVQGRLKETLGSIAPELNELGLSYEGLIRQFQDGTIEDTLRDLAGQAIEGSSAAQKVVGVLGAEYAALAGAIELANEQTTFFGGESTKVNREASTAAMNHLADLEAVGREYKDGVAAGAKAAEDATERLAARQQEIDDYKNAILNAADSYDILKTATDAALSPLLAPDAQQIVDQAVTGLSAGDIAGGGVEAEASLRQLKEDLAEAISEASTEGFNEGLNLTGEQLTTFTMPILAALLEDIDDPALRDELTAFFVEANTVAAAAGAAAAADVLAQGLTEPVVVDPDVSVIPSAERLALITTQVQPINDAVKTAVEQPTTSDASNVSINPTAQDEQRFISAGDSVAADFIAGARAGLVSRAGSLIKKAGEIGDGIAAEIRRRLEITSPSKVMARIGVYIGEGLIVGIEDSEGDVIDAAVDHIKNVIDAAINAAEEGQELMAAAAAGLFGAFVGPGASVSNGLDLTQAAAAGQAAIANIADTLQSAISSVFSVAAKIGEGEALTFAEQDVAGEDPFSLNVGDVLGRANRQAILDTLETITDYGEIMLEQGATAQQVVDTIGPMIDETLRYATALGFNREQLEAIVEAAGLSDAALADYITNVEKTAAAAADAAAKAAADAASEALAEAAEEAAEAAKEAAEELAETLQEAADAAQDAAEAAADAAREAAAALAERAEMIEDAVLFDDKDIITFGQVGGLFGAALDEFFNQVKAKQLELADASTDELDAIGRSFGLYGDALAAWIADVLEWQGVVPEGGENGGIPGIPNLPGNAPVEQNNYFELYLPFGDPDAIALAVVNKMAVEAGVDL